jgi:hypothetical protein
MIHLLLFYQIFKKQSEKILLSIFYNVKLYRVISKVESSINSQLFLKWLKLRKHYKFLKVVSKKTNHLCN